MLLSFFFYQTSKNSLSELEKRERRAMERKLSEMEEELKVGRQSIKIKYKKDPKTDFGFFNLLNVRVQSYAIIERIVCNSLGTQPVKHHSLIHNQLIFIFSFYKSFD